MMSFGSCAASIAFHVTPTCAIALNGNAGAVHALETAFVISDKMASRKISLSLPQEVHADAFKLALVLFLLAVFWFIARWRMHTYAEQMKMRFDERLQERTRLARDLHDTMLQTIQASKMVADDALDPQADIIRMRTALNKLSDWLEKASDEGRAALESLRISHTESNDLTASLDRALFECRLRRRIETELFVNGTPITLHPVLNDEIFRIASEAVRNACVHSTGEKLFIELDYRRNLTLKITDNGTGMDNRILNNGRPGHFGLVGMRERAARIGARFSIASDATGTVVSLSVPRRVVYTAAFRLDVAE
jgi:signal transduction histidine kinase